MSFGKRALGSPAPRRRPSGKGDLQRERLERMRDHVVSLFEVAKQMASAIKGEGSIAMPVIADELDLLSGPFVLKGFHEHFLIASPAGVGHIMFGYAHPTQDMGIDTNAQFHLQQMTGRALALNAFCQRAHLDEALIVALQSPAVPDLIDPLLVSTAFFAAYFENLVDATPDDDGVQPEINIGRQKATLARHLLMAQDRMLAPEKLDSLTPMRGWPFMGVVIPCEPHNGDHFINGVYFSAELASVMLRGVVPSQRRQLPAVA